MNPQPHPEFLARGVHSVVPQWPHQDGVRWFMNDGCSELVKSKYGRPGDRLWVRETCRADELPDGLDGVRYLADDHFERIKNTEDAADQWVAMHHYRGGNGGGLIGPTLPTIHMPRWASRITLEVTGIRVERLQDISDADARAEGIGRDQCQDWHSVSYYRALWEKINGLGSWDANPWVWVIEFKRLEGGAA